MNPEQLKQFEKTLLEKRRGITENPSRIALAMEPEYGQDEGDRVSASQAKEMTWLRTSQERGLLALIDSALSRIHAGTFGECRHCGEEIGGRRLAAIPWTQYCITCQELVEQYGS